MIKVLHVITDLDVGGAEMMLYKLLSRTDRDRFSSEVVSLTDVGSIGERIAALGVSVEALGMRFGVPDPRGLWRLVTRMRRARPDVVQTWMYHADLLGGLAARASGSPPVAWGVHMSDLDLVYNRRLTVRTARLCARLSKRLPASIVCCSESSKDGHQALGYDAARTVVIPNGIDTDAFAPDDVARKEIRAELGLAPDAFVIGMVARFHPIKNHSLFFDGASRLRGRDDVYFVLCGHRVDPANDDLVRWAREAGVSERTFLLGSRADAARVTAALDVATLCSHGEAFPNVVGEAMACAVPCVVTDVGDCAALVGDTGRVVAESDPDALAAAWAELLSLDEPARRALGARARERIERLYGLGPSVARYEELYADLARR